jgi:hypothetical protein
MVWNSSVTALREPLREPLKNVVGGTTAKVMAEHLGLGTVGDLLHHYPRRYAERGELTRLAELPLDEHVTVVAEIADARVHTFDRGRGQRLEVTLTDGSGRLRLVFFGRAVHHHKKELLPGRRAMFAGKVSVFNHQLQLSHPADELLLAGITGTLGKTSVLAMLEHILLHAGVRVGAIGSEIIGIRLGEDLDLETPHTTPDPLRLHHGLRRLADAGATMACMEVTSHALDQERVHGLQLDLGLFTGLVPLEHTDYHAVFEDYVEIKLRFRDLLRPVAPLVFNGDSALLRARLAEAGLPEPGKDVATAWTWDDLAENARWAWSHPVETDRMGREARREYRARFTAEKNYEMLMEIYDRALKIRSHK